MLIVMYKYKIFLHLATVKVVDKKSEEKMFEKKINKWINIMKLEVKIILTDLMES